MTKPSGIPGWSFPCEVVKRTKGTVFRALVAVTHLQPLPGGKPVQISYHLKQWDKDAKEPGSWCLDQMKYAGNMEGESMDPYQALQHVQWSERDWPALLAPWREGVREALLESIRQLQAMAGR